MMTQIQPGVQQPLQNASSQILISASTSITDTPAQTTTSLPNAPYYRPGIPYHIFQNVVLPAFNSTPGSLKTNELQTTIPTSSALSVASSTIPHEIIFFNSSSSPWQEGAVRGVRQVLRQLVGAEGSHADARRPPVQMQASNSVDFSGLADWHKMWWRLWAVSFSKHGTFILVR